MQLVHMKLRSGTDLITYITQESKSHFTIKNPVQFGFDPSNGIYGLEWLLLSENNSGDLFKGEILMINKCSERATKFYNEFMNRHSEDNRSEDLPTDNDLESMFTAMLESKAAIKH